MAAGFTAFGPLAVFFLGALAVLVREELGFSEAGLGITVATFFATATIASSLLGKVAERLGGRNSLRLGLTGSMLALTGASLAGGWWQLTLALAFAGVAHAMLQVAANLLLADQVPLHRKGLAFGIKQSAIPMATLTAGAAVPLLGTQYGWRPAYGAVALLALLALASQWRTIRAARTIRTATPQARPRRGALSYSRGELAALTVAAALGAGSVNAFGTFLVEYAVSVGVAVGVAGGLLAAVSALGIASRIGIGHFADVRAPVGFGSVAVLLIVGALAFLTLPLATTSIAVLWIAAALTFTAGWGWPGLFTFIVARENAAAPARATGQTQAGIFAGAVAGPLLFGFAVTSLSYDVAWRAAGLSQLLTAVLILLVRRSRAHTATTAA